MVFSSLIFIYAFLPLPLLCCMLCGSLKAKNISLLVFSLIFYAWGEPKYVLLLMLMAAVDWFCALQAFSGMDYGTFHEANARDVPYDVYLQYLDRLPVPWMRRCEHWDTEFQRVEAGAEAWRRGDIEEYGRLSFASGWSSIHNWES